MYSSRLSSLYILFLASLVGLLLLPREAHAQAEVFVEPSATVTRIFGDRTGFVGIRAGVASKRGFSAEMGIDVLTHSVYRNPGPYLGDKLTDMTRLSLGFHYSHYLVAGLHGSIGGSSSVGLAQGQFCGGTDVCTSPEWYSSIGPEIGLRQQITSLLSLQLGGGYRWQQLESTNRAPFVEGSVRVWP